MCDGTFNNWFDRHIWIQDFISLRNWPCDWTDSYSPFITGYSPGQWIIQASVRIYAARTHTSLNSATTLRGVNECICRCRCSPFIMACWKSCCVQSYSLVFQIGPFTISLNMTDPGGILDSIPDSNFHVAHMGPICVLSAPGCPMLASWTLLSGMKPKQSHFQGRQFKFRQL